MSSHKKYHAVLLVLVLIVWIWSAIGVQDTYLTWFLETVPFMIALPILLFTYKRAPLSDFAYTIIAIHAAVLMIGGHYSYANVPLGFWMEHWFGWTRNNYDKIGHFMQGFGPFFYTREILLMTSPLKRGKWLAFISIAIPLAFSALYEIFEYAASVWGNTGTEAFLGTQGYVWDTQTDMLMCLVGSITAWIFFSKLHDRFLKKA